MIAELLVLDIQFFNNRKLKYIELGQHPSVNFKADFLKTAQGSFMKIWPNHGCFEPGFLMMIWNRKELNWIPLMCMKIFSLKIQQAAVGVVFWIHCSIKRRAYKICEIDMRRWYCSFMWCDGTSQNTYPGQQLTENGIKIIHHMTHTSSIHR